MNKFLSVFVLLICLGSSSLNWIDFVNENGESVNTAGMELAANYGANAGGNGGGAKTLSCDFKKGISQICMTQGRKFIGKITLKCKDGSAAQSCGIANGDGRGSDVCYSVPSGGVRGVSAVTSKDGRYIKSVTLYAQNKSVLKTFSASDVSEAGPSIFAFGGVDTTKGALLGLQLRCGWWLDAVKAGFGVLSANCVLGKQTCGACNKSSGTQECTAAVTTPQTGDGKCTPKSTKKCAVNCEQTVGAFGSCNKACGGGTKTRTVKQTVSAKNGGKACERVATSQACNTQPCDDNVANSGSKSDFESRNRGNDLRKWFNGPTLKSTGEKIVGSVYYRDQGWGNKKTDVFFCCNCSSGSVQSGGNCVSLCGTNVRGSYKKCEFNKNVPSSCAKGKSTCVAYRVGGGGGHRFYGKQFSAKLKYKQIAGMTTQIEDDDVIFEGEFISAAFFDEEEFDDEEEELSSYSSYGVFAGAVAFMGAVGGAAAFVYKKRKEENCEYENILDV